MHSYTRDFTAARSKGFTLIELLVVIAIIGILASIILASLDSARRKGRDARRIADIKQIQLALELYYDQNNNYPATISVASLVTPGYISAIPTDPQLATQPYSYAALGSGTTCSSYHLGASLENASHSVLSTDADAAVGTTCNGSAADFSGVDGSKCNTADPGVACYDVKP